MKKLLVLIAFFGLILNNSILVIAGAPGVQVLQSFINNSDITEDFTKIPNIERCSGGPYNDLKILLASKGLINKVETKNYACAHPATVGFAEMILNYVIHYPNNFFSQNSNFDDYRIKMDSESLYNTCNGAAGCAGGSFKLPFNNDPAYVYETYLRHSLKTLRTENTFQHEIAHDIHLTFNNNTPLVNTFNNSWVLNNPVNFQYFGCNVFIQTTCNISQAEIQSKCQDNTAFLEDNQNCYQRVNFKEDIASLAAFSLSNDKTILYKSLERNDNLLNNKLVLLKTLYNNLGYNIQPQIDTTSFIFSSLYKNDTNITTEERNKPQLEINIGTSVPTDSVSGVIKNKLSTNLCIDLNNLSSNELSSSVIDYKLRNGTSTNIINLSNNCNIEEINITFTNISLTRDILKKIVIPMYQQNTAGKSFIRSNVNSLLSYSKNTNNYESSYQSAFYSPSDFTTKPRIEKYVSFNDNKIYLSYGNSIYPYLQNSYLNLHNEISLLFEGCNSPIVASLEKNEAIVWTDQLIPSCAKTGINKLAISAPYAETIYVEYNIIPKTKYGILPKNVYIDNFAINSLPNIENFNSTIPDGELLTLSQDCVGQMFDCRQFYFEYIKNGNLLRPFTSASFSNFIAPGFIFNLENVVIQTTSADYLTDPPIKFKLIKNTISTVSDSDHDQKPDAEEDSILLGDANSDSVPDKYQTLVSSKKVEAGTGVVDLTTTNCTTLDTVDVTKASNVPLFDSLSSELSFTGSCTGTNKIKVLLSAKDSSNGYKLLKKNKDGVWKVVELALLTPKTLNNEKFVEASFDLEDNGEFDLDPRVGFVSDPLMLVQNSTVVSTSPNTPLTSTLQIASVTELVKTGLNTNFSLAISILSVTFLVIIGYLSSKQYKYNYNGYWIQSKHLDKLVTIRNKKAK
jgi:hypothetical protein